LQAGCKTVELWTLPAEKFLAEADVGIVPWVPLMKWDGAPEAILERCAERIEREAQPKYRTDLQVVSQVLAELKYPSLDLVSFFGGDKAMIDSLLINRVRADMMPPRGDV
jgi:hypothetical protein